MRAAEAEGQEAEEVRGPVKWSSRYDRERVRVEKTAGKNVSLRLLEPKMSSETGPRASQGEKGHSVQTISQRMRDMTLPISEVGTHSRVLPPPLC